MHQRVKFRVRVRVRFASEVVLSTCKYRRKRSAKGI